MGKVAVVTDTNSGILPDRAEEMGVYTVPMPFYIDGKIYLEGKTLTHEEFFRFQEADAEIKTSMPAVGDVVEMWENVLQNHDQLVYIPMSSALSGSCQAAMLLAQGFKDRVFVVDNQRISVTQRQAVQEAKAFADAGMDGAEIQKRLYESRGDASIYLAVDTLKYLHKGGRISSATAVVGTVLNIKPILSIKGDRLEAFSKVRGKAAAKQKLVQTLKEDIANNPVFAAAEKAGKLGVGVAYTGNNEEALALEKIMRKTFPKHLFQMDPLALSITCHTGRGALGVGCYVDISKDMR